MYEIPEISAGEISEDSRIIASFEWKVPDFFEFPKDLGLRVVSPAFSFLDSRWYLHVYPNGVGRYNPEWIGLFLTKYDYDREQEVRCHFGIRDRDGVKYETYTKDYHCHLYDSVIGRTKFVRPTTLLERSASSEGTVIFFCTLHTKADESNEIASKTMHPEGAEKVIHDLKGLLLSGDASDLTMKVKNREFRVHSAILAARSSVFAAMMRHDMKEKRSRITEIKDCEPDTFHKFLNYIYSGEIENPSKDTVCALFDIAEKYDVQELKRSCMQFIMDNVCVETLCDVLTLSFRHDESELLQKATAYFAENMEQILDTDSWLSFVKENPAQAIELHKKAMKYLVFTQ